MSKRFLHCEEIKKSFGETKALKGVSMDVYAGDIRGLLGENGSGKSTLSSIIAGVQGCDSGTMQLEDGREYTPHTMVEAQEHGISMIVQESGIILDISVAANIFVGKESRFKKYGLLDLKKMNAEAARILDKIGVGYIDPKKMAKELNMEDRKFVEIARALYDEPALLIVDETTTTLSQKGRNFLYGIMRDMAARGRSVVFISHDLDEIMGICNCATVLRDGELTANLTRDEMEINRIRELMVGRELLGSYYREDFDGSYGEEVVLKVENVTLSELVENVSLELHKGEILGLAGLTESGMHELGLAIYGEEKLLTGSISLASGKKIKNCRVALGNGIGYVSKNRDAEALVLSASIQDNITLPSLRRLAKLGYITSKSERELAVKEIKEMNIKCASEKQGVMALSGGNKQKVVFAKLLGNDTDIFILDCPTRGIDIGVKSAMYQLMYQLKKEGKSILMISEELTEVIGMSDRILFMRNGKISGELSRSADLTERTAIQYII